MVIARKDCLELRHKSFIDDRTPTTHDIEIVRWVDAERPYCYTIASFNTAGDIMSCGDRLMRVLCEDPDYVEIVNDLADIARGVFELPEVTTNTYGYKIEWENRNE